MSWTVIITGYIRFEPIRITYTDCVHTYRYYNVEETGSKRMHTHILGWLTAAYAEKMCDRFNYMVRAYDETHPSEELPRPRGLEVVNLGDLVDPHTGRLSVRKILSSNQLSHRLFLEWFIDQHVIAQLPPVVQPELPATTEPIVESTTAAPELPATMEPIVESTTAAPRRPLWSQQLFDAAAYNQDSVAPKWEVTTGLSYAAVSDPTTTHGRSLKRLRECVLENNQHRYVAF